MAAVAAGAGARVLGFFGALVSSFREKQTPMSITRILLILLNIVLGLVSRILATNELNNKETPDEILDRNRGVYVATGVIALLTFIFELSRVPSAEAPTLSIITKGILGFLAIMFITGYTFAIGRIVTRNTPEAQNTYSQTNVLGVFGGALAAAVITLLFLQSENPIVHFLFATAVISAAVLSMDTTIVRMRHYAR